MVPLSRMELRVYRVCRGLDLRHYEAMRPEAKVPQAGSLRTTPGSASAPQAWGLRLDTPLLPNFLSIPRPPSAPGLALSLCLRGAVQPALHTAA